MKLAALFIRFWGLTYLYAACCTATYLPFYVMRANNAHMNQLRTAGMYDAELFMCILRLLSEVSVGFALLLFWKPLVLALTKCVDTQNTNKVPQTTAFGQGKTLL